MKNIIWLTCFIGFIYFSLSGVIPSTISIIVALSWVAYDFFFDNEPPRWLKEDMKRIKEDNNHG
jgi:hypothetical protein